MSFRIIAQTKIVRRLPTIRVNTFSAFATTSMASTISDAVKTDHRELEEYARTILESKDQDTQKRFQNQFTWELARHSVAEELVLYPAFEKYMGVDGKNKAEKDRADHQEIKAELKKFQNLEPSSEEFMPTLQSLMADLRKHINEEESEDLPALEESLKSSEDRQDSEALAKSFDRSKMFVPTRSHPSAPDRPPFETAVGLMTAPIDRLMDIFRKFP